MHEASHIGESEYVIRTHQLTRTFGSLTAVNNISLEVRRRDVFGFLGPNGSGKTTTIRMLLGLIRPTSGSITIFGMNNASHLPAILPRLGAIVETPVFYPYLSGIDNLRTVAAASGMRIGRANQQRIDEVLEMVDLSHQAKDAFRKYSLGMKQRLAIGAALLTDPELIMLDEPTNGLDPAGVHEVRQLILRLSQAGKTIFISSHLLYEVQQVCNRVAILQRGKLLRQGYVQELLSEHQQLVLRLKTADETRQARLVLDQAAQQGASWIGAVQEETDERGRNVLCLAVPEEKSASLCELLAHRQLYIAAMYPQQSNLEEFFLQLTETARGAETRRGMGDFVMPSTHDMSQPATSPTGKRG